jgi:cell division protein FtsX
LPVQRHPCAALALCLVLAGAVAGCGGDDGVRTFTLAADGSTTVVTLTLPPRDACPVAVFFALDAGATAIAALRRRLAADPEIDELHVLSRAQAMRDMRRRYPELVENLPSNPLPASARFTAPTRHARELATTLRRAPGVDNVRVGGGPLAPCR